MCETCQNCGIEISQTPEKDGLKKIQMRYNEPEGVFCEPCAMQAPEYGEYEQDGGQILKTLEN